MSQQRQRRRAPGLLVVGALSWITGRIDVDVTPNIKQMTPQADPKPFADAKK